MGKNGEWTKLFAKERNPVDVVSDREKAVQRTFTDQQKKEVALIREVLADLVPEWAGKEQFFSNLDAGVVVNLVSFYAQMTQQSYEDAALGLYRRLDGESVLEGRSLDECASFAVQCKELFCEEYVTKENVLNAFGEKMGGFIKAELNIA